MRSNRELAWRLKNFDAVWQRVAAAAGDRPSGEPEALRLMPRRSRCRKSCRG